MNVDPIKTAVLVIDMQNDFYGDGGSAVRRNKPVAQMQALPAKINEFTQTMRDKGSMIIFTKFISGEDVSPKNFIERMKSDNDTVYTCADQAGAKLEGVNVDSSDQVIEKTSYDSFAGTNLASLLNKNAIETVVIAGVRTEFCVMATASRSFAEGYSTYVLSDLIGTYDHKQKIGDIVHEVLRYSAFVMTSGEFLKRLD